MSIGSDIFQASRMSYAEKFSQLSFKRMFASYKVHVYVQLRSKHFVTCYTEKNKVLFLSSRLSTINFHIKVIMIIHNFEQLVWQPRVKLQLFFLNYDKIFIRKLGIMIVDLNSWEKVVTCILFSGPSSSYNWLPLEYNYDTLSKVTLTLQFLVNSSTSFLGPVHVHLKVPHFCYYRFIQKFPYSMQTV